MNIWIEYPVILFMLYIFYSQYSNDYLYDDEYDDRDDDGANIKVADNPLDQDILICNPNREDLVSDTSYSSEDDYDHNGKPVNIAGKSKESSDTR